MDEPRDHEAEERPPARSTEGVRIIGAEEAQAAIESGAVAGRRPDDAPRFGDVPEAPAGPRPQLRFPLGAGTDPSEVTRAVRGEAGDDEGGLRWGDDTAATELPHWTEPPSGETPRVGDDDLGAWSSFAQAPRWRDHPADWDEVHADDPLSWAGDERVQVPDDRPPPDEPFAFDVPEAPAEVPPARIRSRREPVAPPPLRQGPGRDVGMAVAVGLGIGAVVLLMLRYLENLGGVLVAGVALTIASIELVNALARRGFRPAKLLVWVGTAATTWAAYARGEQAIPLLVALFVAFGLLWYLFGVETRQPAANVAVSLFAYAYVGVLGAFAALLLRWAPGRHEDGMGLFLGAVIATVAYDVGGFAIGSRAGRTPLAPAISPNKTWEGLIGGSFVAFAASVLVVTQIHPWDLRNAFALGVVAAVLAPLGDLCESMLKRDLGVKDMGSLLPEHGGVLDRIDAMLFVVPAVYYLAKLANIGLP